MQQELQDNPARNPPVEQWDDVGNPSSAFIVDVAQSMPPDTHPYMDEINEGVLRQFARMKPATGRVLDVGCGSGALGGAIRDLGWETWGIELNHTASDVARGRLDRLIEADLQDGETISGQLRDTQFDIVILSDVLEHLYNPRAVLVYYLQYLKPGGKLIISVPNAVVWTNRFSWLFGYFEYTDTGVMDRTHVRFFTFRTIRRLVQSLGCRVVKSDFTPFVARAALPLVKRVIWTRSGGVPNPRALIDSREYKLYMRYAYPVERVLAGLWKAMFAFRIIVVAVKPGAITDNGGIDALRRSRPR